MENHTLRDRPDGAAESTFAHFGCLLGSIIGLSAGVALAWVLTLRTGSLGVAMGAWVAITVVLAALGYALGARRRRA